MTVAVRVQRLDPVTAGRIAAGEVIERPASVVKELLDNALDAASTRIDIDIFNGGRRLIQVTDNGCGMYPDEAELALQRFTTSKIRRLEDLSRLATLGFRGEALPSIVAMAEVEITTRPTDQAEGVLVQAGPDRAPSARPIGCPLGTRVRVHRLFARTPVRLNALKSVAREVQQIREVVARYALAYPQVTFHVQHDGRRLLFAPACADFLQRLPVVFDRALAAQMLPVYWQSVDLLVCGAVSAPAVHRAARQRQYVWVNGRPIRSGLVVSALERAYGALLPPGRHPVAALGLSLPPQFLDVNVHPRKTEVTFVHERAMFAAVQEAVETVLQRYVTGEADGEGEGTRDWSSLWVATPGIGDAGAPYGAEPPPVPADLWQPLGQVGHTFIVASGPEGLLLLDQHAADECLLYAQLMAAEEASVELPEPLLLTLSATQQRWLDMLHAALATFRIQVEPFGKETVLLRAVPAGFVERLGLGNFLETLHEAMQRITPQTTAEEVREHLGAALACRTALRAGDRLTAEQVTALVQAVAQQRLPYTCPHGRPTYVTLSLSDLERRFLRLFPLDTSSSGC
jgi:DNA mismatch repair protein MutL